MRRVPIRIKLAVALAIPLLAMGLVTVIEVASVAREARDVRDQTELATATIGPNGLITALQNERNWTSAHLVGVDQQLDLEVTGYDRTRADTDDARAEFELELDRRGEAASAAYAEALDGLASLRDLRSEIDTYADDTDLSLANIALTTGLFDRFTALIEPFFGGMSRISIAMNDPELRQGALLMATVTRQLETVPQLTNALVLPATVPAGDGDRAGIDRPAEIAEVAHLQDIFRRLADRLRSATGPLAEIAAQYFPEEFTRTLDEQTSQAIATGQIDVDVLLSGLEAPSPDLPYVGYRDQVATALQDRADELNASATSRQARFALLMAVTFAAAVALTVPVSLSITRPLRSLTRQAKDMADHRLPEAVTDILDTPLGEDVRVPEVAPVRVATRDEVADVADALNTVQDSALDLAVEQAVLRRNIADSFVNLGRRNQNLLGRQLDFITELESRETNPDTLASLFRLDHLATRMRRNAESLLVLAGIEPPRQWAAPVRLTDVIRAALGEVENYQRVTVRRVEPATIVGSAAADQAHLLAELIENALVFSPPDQTVDIRGVAQSSGQPGGYTLAVIDCGLGMPPADIAAANRRLAGAESFTIAPSKYLGHYVAGNLAARHDITVHLHSSPGTGITATVELPADLLTADPGALAAPVTPRRGQRSLAAPAPAAMSPTPGGLVPRAPRQPGVAPAGPMRAPASRTDAHLASLARAAARARAGQHPAAPAGPARAAPGGPWPGGQPFGQAGTGTGMPWPPPHTGPGVGAPPPLTRRDRGAQMPVTTPHSVRRTPPASAALGGPSPSHPPRAALEIYGFLASFTAGVQRGLAATRTVHRDEPGR